MIHFISKSSLRLCAFALKFTEMLIEVTFWHHFRYIFTFSVALNTKLNGRVERGSPALSLGQTTCTDFQFHGLPSKLSALKALSASCLHIIGILSLAYTLESYGDIEPPYAKLCIMTPEGTPEKGV